MAKLHFEEYSYSRDLFNVEAEDVKGDKFDKWQEKASYFVSVTIVIQVDTTNVSDKEYSVSPGITFLSTNQAIVNIYKTTKFENVSFEDFNNKYSVWETALERHVSDLVVKLNNARAEAGLIGEWYINYSLNERRIEVSKPSG